jgi:hypothetical protein
MRLITTIFLFVFVLASQEIRPRNRSPHKNNRCDSAMTQREMTECSDQQYR